MQLCKSSLIQFTRAIVEPMQYELVNVEYFQHHNGHGTLRVYIDHANGVTVDDCARVSDQLSGALDLENPFPGQYRLEVSSPGMDRPLVFPEHFVRFLGNRVRIRLTEKIENRRILTGILREYGNECLIIESDGQNWRIPLNILESARLAPEMTKIAKKYSKIKK